MPWLKAGVWGLMCALVFAQCKKSPSRTVYIDSSIDTPSNSDEAPFVPVQGSVRVVLHVVGTALDIPRVFEVVYMGLGMYRNNPVWASETPHVVTMPEGVASIESVLGDYSLPQGSYGVLVLKWREQGNPHTYLTYVDTPLWEVSDGHTWVLRVTLDANTSRTTLLEIQEVVENVPQTPLWTHNKGEDYISPAQYNMDLPAKIPLKAQALNQVNCRWECDNPSCPALCNPVCDPPVCAPQCDPVLFPAECSCERHCEPPRCETVCPGESCPSDACPFCFTRCEPADCINQCSGGCEPVQQLTCHMQCEDPNCVWQCEKPSCARPQCSLKCEAL